MNYKYPTTNNVRFAIDQGWSPTQAIRGYEIFDYDGTGLIDIEMICDCHDGCLDDESAAREAERTGFCKIIPVDELPENVTINGNDVRWFGWVDTPENRENIRKWVINNG